MTDVDGKPVPGVQVSALARTWIAVAGERRLIPAPTQTASTTDDRGTYRIFGLAAGSYVVMAGTPPRGGAVPGDLVPVTESDVRLALAELRDGMSRPQPAPRNAAATETIAEPRRVRVAPVFYPGTADSSQASTITLRAGEERATCSCSTFRRQQSPGLSLLPLPGTPTFWSVSFE